MTRNFKTEFKRSIIVTTIIILCAAAGVYLCGICFEGIMQIGYGESVKAAEITDYGTIRLFGQTFDLSFLQILNYGAVLMEKVSLPARRFVTELIKFIIDLFINAG